MLLNGAGGVPLIEGLADKLIGAHLRPFATVVMLLAYVFASALMVSIYICIPKLKKSIKSRK